MVTIRSDETDPMADAGPTYTTELAIPSDPAEARRVQDEIERALKEQHYTDHEVFSIKLALEEALVNAIKHGNGMDRAKSVRVAYRIAADRFDVCVSDEGPGFDPDDVPDPTAVENLERPCGRGVMLMKHYMHRVCYHGAGNCVSMTKFRPAAGGPGTGNGQAPPG